MTDPSFGLDPVADLAGEFAERYRRGERLSISEYTDRYPALADQIRELFPTLMMIEELGSVEEPGPSAGAAPSLGKVPEQLGDFRILREVGRGGMGVVYEAVQESLGRHVALKVLPAHGLMPPTHLERFRREARAAARLHHTNIVPVHGVGEHDGVHYYAMQFIQGQGLDEVLKEVKRLRGKEDSPSTGSTGRGTDRSQRLAQNLLSGQFPGAAAPGPTSAGSANSQAEHLAQDSPGPTAAAAGSKHPASGSSSGTELTSQTEAQYSRSVAQMVVQVAAGLDYAHKQGILHRDIKPSNLLLDARGTVWITDFGLAKAEGSDELTHTGDLVGTLRYMAPERMRGWSDPRSDVYGLGITLYELLTLRPAFENPCRPGLIEQVRLDDPPQLRKVDRSIPRDLETIVCKAIDKEPGRRYQTAAELARDLGRFLAGEPVLARRITVWERGVKWVKRRPAVAALLAFSVAAVIFLIVGSLLHTVQLGAALHDAEVSLDKARLAEDQARNAEQEQTCQLAIAYLREAQARRHSGLMGRRFESLETVQKAAALFRALGRLDSDRTVEVRNEAIACLALADLKPAKGRGRDPGWSVPMAFDPAVQHYVVRSAADDHAEKGAVPQGVLSIRRVADGQELARLPGFGVRVVAAQFSPDGRYLAAHYEWGPRHNYVWDLSRPEAILQVSPGSYYSFPAFSPDSRLAALVQADRSIRIYQLPSGAKWKDLPPGPPATNLSFQPEAGRLAVASGRLVQLRDLNGGAVVATFEHANDVFALAWRSDGKQFATGCRDGAIYVWDPANASRPPRILKRHSSAVVSLVFSHGGDLLFSNSWDSMDRLWDPGAEQPLVSRPGGSYHFFSFTPDDRALDDGCQVATGRECRTFHGSKIPNRVAICPAGPLKGRLMASVHEDAVQLWDLAAPLEGDKLLGTVPAVGSLAVAFAPAGDYLFTDDRGAGLQRWPITPDPQTGTVRLGPPQSPGLSPQAPGLWSPYEPEFELSADGRTVAHSARPGHVFLFDWENPGRKLLIESPGLRQPVFSPDGRWLAAGNWHGQGARVWDARTGKEAKSFDLPEPDEGNAWPVFSPDGKWLVLGTAVEYSFWAVGSWQKRYTLTRENAGKTRGWIVFAPDSKMVALLHSVNEIRLVDPGTGQELARLPAGGTPYCFSPDGSQLVTYAGRGGAMHIWDLRLIRRQLKEMDLDWDLPPYPLPSAEDAIPLRLTVVAGERPPASNVLCAAAHLERGLLYVQKRKYADAWTDCAQADTLNPSPLLWEKLDRACSHMLERDPEDADAYHLRARAYERLGRWEEAIDSDTQAIRRAPRRPEFHAHRGWSYLRIDQRDRAAEDFRKASEGDAGQANYLAWTLITSPDSVCREPALAVELAQQAVGQARGEAMYWTTLGIAYYRLGESERAVQALEKSEMLEPGNRLGFNAFFLAMCHHQLGDPGKARDHYNRAVGWCQENQGKLPAVWRQQLESIHAEGKALLKVPPGANARFQSG
jgi:serine/threonine protein kinase/WD40 repeat protein/tetratricopeptide (TPR) repeat protein